MNDILIVENVELKYGNIKALNDVSLKVGNGEIVCLIGANGAGKTSLLKSIVGLEPIEKGKIIFQEEVIVSEISSLKTNKIFEKGISLVPEGRGVFSQMTVLENLEMGGFLVKDKNLFNSRLSKVYDFFPILKDRAKQKAGLLSGGEQQMLAIGRALMSQPKLLLLDEPGLGLAPLIVKNIFEIIKLINSENKTSILIVEQNAKLALKNSNRGYVMETGNIIMSDFSINLINDKKVKSAYLGE